MTLDLKGTHLKLARADKHIAELEAVIRRHGRPHRVAADEGDRQVTSGGVVTLAGYRGPQAQLPDDLALVVGDCLSNLRAALDHLAWQVVDALGLDPYEHTGFPIRDSSKAFIKGRRGQVTGPVADVIDLVQPYHRVNDPTSDLLCVLNNLRNKDSHRSLHLVADVLQTLTLISRDRRTGSIVGQHVFQRLRLNPGDAVSVTIPPSDAEQQHDLVITVDVALDESGLAGSVPVVTLLSDIGEHIRRAVLRPIAALLG